jgi:hypothetical protein
MLHWPHEPRRHANHVCRPDTNGSGTHTSGEKCAMPAWLHGEWRLLHANVPAFSGSRPEGAMPERARAES